MEDLDDPAILSARLDMATRAARIAVWELDLVTGALLLSPVFLQILGVPPEEFGGHISDFIDRVVPEDRERVQRALQSHQRNDVPYDIEYQMFHTDGRRLVIAAQGQKVLNGAGKPIRMVGTVQDITVRRALEQRLLQAEQVARVGHWYLEVPKNELYWSPGTYLIHGMDPSLPQPDTVQALDYYHEEDRAHVAEALERVLATGEPEEIDARLVLADGEVRYVHVDGVAELSEEGRPQRLFGVIHDRTELVKKEKELEHAHRLEAVGQLAGGVAHDFNNLMTVILGTLELLQEEEPSSTTERTSLFEGAVHAVSQGRNLTQALLNFARSASLRPETVAASELLEELHGFLERTLPASLTLKTSGAHASCSVFADRGNLEACLLNLVFNARDAIQGHGEIELTARDVDLEECGSFEKGLRPGAYVAFEVRDDGKGIAREDLGRVFEPFFSTKAAGDGSGLGLSRVKGFAEQSGGTVRIESEVGKGTCVSILLPCAKSDSPSRIPQGSMGEHPLEPATVLLVEDLETVREVMTVRLEREGHNVFSVGDASAALDVFERHPEIDVVLCDVVIPGALQGPDLVREMRSRRPGLPAVFISGYSGDAFAKKHSIAQEDAFLTKPIGRDELIRTLRRALARS